MTSINIGVLRFVQFVNLLVFSFIVICYVAVIILLPLDLFFHLIRLLQFLPWIVEIFVAGGIVGYLVWHIISKPSIVKVLLDGGVELAMLAYHQVTRYNDLIAKAKQTS